MWVKFFILLWTSDTRRPFPFSLQFSVFFPYGILSTSFNRACPFCFCCPFLFFSSSAKQINCTRSNNIPQKGSKVLRLAAALSLSHVWTQSTGSITRVSLVSEANSRSAFCGSHFTTCVCPLTVSIATMPLRTLEQLLCQRLALRPSQISGLPVSLSTLFQLTKLNKPGKSGLCALQHRWIDSYGLRLYSIHSRAVTHSDSANKCVLSIHPAAAFCV